MRHWGWVILAAAFQVGRGPALAQSSNGSPSEKRESREGRNGAADSVVERERYVIILTGDESTPEKVLQRYPEIAAAWPKVATYNLLRPGTAIELSRDMLGRDRPLARLAQVYGETEVRRPFDARFIPACSNLLVREGDVLRTWRRAGARIVFEDGSYFLLRGNSRAELASLGSQASKTRLLLSEGSLLSRIKKGSGRFEVETPTASTIIRGTEFRVKVEAGDATRLEVLDGEVELHSEGHSLAVPALRGSLTQRGTGPSAVQQLLAGPASLREPQDKQVVRAAAFDQRFSWSSVPGAVAYRVEVSRDENFFDLIEEVLAGGELSAPIRGLDEGTYFWRVSAIGANGFEGPPSDSSYFVFVKTRS